MADEEKTPPKDDQKEQKPLPPISSARPRKRYKQMAVGVGSEGSMD